MVSIRKITGIFVFSLVIALPLRAEVPVEPRLYDIDPETSRVMIYVSRGGLMRRAGHDHVIASENISGEVTLAPDGSSLAELRIPLTELVVDAPRYRKRFELDPEVSESSIRGTRRNMLEKVLDVETHPSVQVRAIPVDASAQPTVLMVEIELQGATAEYEVPVSLAIESERIEVSGSFTILHSDFGIRPFRAAAGLLRVADELDIHFEVVANVGSE